MDKFGIVKKRWLVDTDWITALVIAGVLVVCAFMAVMDLLRVTQQITVPIKVTWETWILVVFGFWFFFTTKDRVIRAGAVLIAVQAILKIVFWLLHASVTAQLANAVIFPIINIFAFLSVALYAAWWLRTKVSRI